MQNFQDTFDETLSYHLSVLVSICMAVLLMQFPDISHWKSTKKVGGI